MFKIIRKFISIKNKEGDMYSYFKDRNNIEYFKINIGKLDYFVKTVQGNLQTFFVYDKITKKYRYLNTREEFKLSVEFKKSHSFFKEQNIYKKNNSLLPFIFNKFDSELIE
jgi:hypothetical protein